MRILELVLLLVNLVLIGWSLFSSRSRSRWLTWLSGTGVIILVLHLVLEGYRWQMVPVYALTIALAALAIRRRFRPADGRAQRTIGSIAIGVLGLAWLGIAFALPILLPVFELSDPTGPYTIGTVTYHWTDAARDEPFTADPADHRELMVQIWYPAGPTVGTASDAYIDNADIVGPALARVLGLPSFTLDHLKYVRGHATTNAPVASSQASYPVLVFSHGRGGVRTQNTAEVEELASHGYVVAAIDHTYGAAVTIFPDGRAALIDPQAWPDVFDADFAQVMKERIELFAQDARFVLDQLQQLDSGDAGGMFAGRLDLDRTGIFGHSLGGAVAAEASRLDSRFRAGIDMDAGLFTDVVETGLRQPFMFLSRDKSDFRQQCARLGPETCQTLVDQQFGTIESVFDRSDSGYIVTIKGMNHYNFTDLPFFTPLATALGLAGPIDGRRGLQIVDAYTLAFFDKYLKDQSAPLLDGPAPDYPEAHIQIRAAK